MGEKGERCQKPSVRRLLLLGLAAAFASASSSASATDERTTAFAIVDGRERAISPGEIVAQGRRTGDRCFFRGNVAIGGHLPEEQGSVGLEIQSRTDQKCRMRIISIKPVSGTPAYQTTPVNVPHPLTRRLADPGALRNEIMLLHKGWAKHTVVEYVNITASEVYVEMGYRRVEDVVKDGRNPAFYDYTSDVPGWEVTNEAYTWWPYGPDYVYIYRRTHFTNGAPPRPSYDLSARFDADPRPGFICGFGDGNLPTGWDRECSGGVYY